MNHPVLAKYLDKLERTHQRTQRAQGQRAAAQAKRLEPSIATVQALRRACYGSADNPVGNHLGNLIIDTSTWARWVYRAAQCFRVCPGIKVLKSLPQLRDGEKVGLELFKEAAKAATTEDAFVVAFGQADTVLDARKLRPLDASDFGGKAELQGFLEMLFSAFWTGEWKPRWAATTVATSGRTVANPSRRPDPWANERVKLESRGLHEDQITKVLENLGRLDELNPEIGALSSSEVSRCLTVSVKTLRNDFLKHGKSKRHVTAPQAPIRFPRVYLRAFLLERWKPVIARATRG